MEPMKPPYTFSLPDDIIPRLGTLSLDPAFIALHAVKEKGLL